MSSAIVFFLELTNWCEALFHIPLDCLYNISLLV